MDHDRVISTYYFENFRGLKELEVVCKDCNNSKVINVDLVRSVTIAPTFGQHEHLIVHVEHDVEIAEDGKVEIHVLKLIDDTYFSFASKTQSYLKTLSLETYGNIHLLHVFYDNAESVSRTLEANE